MTTLAFFDLANGISGDMTLSALAHAGRRIDIDVERAITEAVASLDLDCSVTFVDDDRGGLACLRADVQTDGMHRAATALRDAIVRATVHDEPRRRALASLDALIAAEAAVHGVEADDVHFHELASADTAADLLGAAVGLHALGVDRVVAAPIPVPSGWISSEHGPLPLPAPVTLQLLTGARLRGVDADKELVTPSGAAILVGHDATYGVLPEMTMRGVGIGAGRRIGDRPNICRVLIGEGSDGAGAAVENCVVLETNIDDQTPEGVAYAVEQLLARGALDAWLTPIVMKRSRPAFQLCVLARPADEAVLTDAIFHLTTTLGVRRRTSARFVLDRDELSVDVRGQRVRVKVGRLRGEVVNVAPEFADCAAASEATGLALKDVFAHATASARAALDA